MVPSNFSIVSKKMVILMQANFLKTPTVRIGILVSHDQWFSSEWKIANSLHFKYKWLKPTIVIMV